MLQSNRTPFSFIAYPSLSRHGKWITVCILKARVCFQDGEEGVRAVEASEIQMADEYVNEEENSSLLIENDLAPFKPCSDIYLFNTFTYAPEGIDTREWVASVTVGEMSKRLCISPERDWNWSPFRGWSLGPQTGNNVLPDWYEDSFGGAWKHDDGREEWFEQNPVGCGFFPVAPNTSWTIPACTISYEADAYTKPGRTGRPAGFGPIARSWKSRLKFAGTYDSDWQVNRWPLWPQDLDSKFFIAAPEDQHYNGYLQGNELVELTNLTPSGTCKFRLPFLGRPYVLALDDVGESGIYEFQLDTLAIDTDEFEAHVTWRVALDMLEPELLEVRMV